jgi:hypothetical protein
MEGDNEPLRRTSVTWASTRSRWTRSSSPLEDYTEMWEKAKVSKEHVEP